MPALELHDHLAAVAHALWCQKVLANGWRHGPAYDARAKEHDALVPYEQLSRHDQRQIRTGIQYEEIEQLLADSVDYSRGPAREFTVEEMREGLPVALVVAGGPGEEVTGKERGVIESWTVDGEGELLCIRVRWHDGELLDYVPAERALWRVDEL